MTLELNIDSSCSGDICIVKLTGDLDDYNAQKALTFFNQELQKGMKRFVVELDGIKFMDSIGLGVIVKTTKTVQSMGGKLIIVSNKHQINQLIETSGLIKAKKIILMHDLAQAIDLI